MAIRHNQREVRLSADYVKGKFKGAFELGDKIVGVSLQHTLDDKVPDLVIFLVEKPDDQKED